MKSHLFGIAVVFLMAACQSTGGFPSAKGSPYAPSGRGASSQEVDALLVGHRLFAAGEFELALKAYYRAAGKYGPTAEILSAVGSADLRLGRLNQAEQMLRRAIEALFATHGPFAIAVKSQHACATPFLTCST